MSAVETNDEISRCLSALTKLLHEKIDKLCAYGVERDEAMRLTYFPHETKERYHETMAEYDRIFKAKDINARA